MILTLAGIGTIQQAEEKVHVSKEAQATLKEIYCLRGHTTQKQYREYLQATHTALTNALNADTDTTLHRHNSTLPTRSIKRTRRRGSAIHVRWFPTSRHGTARNFCVTRKSPIRLCVCTHFFWMPGRRIVLMVGGCISRFGRPSFNFSQNYSSAHQSRHLHLDLCRQAFPKRPQDNYC